MAPDFLVVGAGVAGLRAAIELAQAGSVLVVAKDTLRESSSEYAQGGIAVALGEDDQVELHEQDTLAAGDGLSDPAAVRVLVEHAPAAIHELIEWGAEFDREGSKLAFGQEGAHSRRRILHAHGDSTGREIARTLYYKAASLPNVEFRSFAAITDLLVSDNGEVAGVLVCDASARHWVPLQARAVLVATGGLGQIYRSTTNPEVATGDGVAAAYRAGAEISDIEFVQFHPTALHLKGVPAFLLSEALRGEGARLLNGAGERFMPHYDERAELAPRDVVSRAIVTEMQRRGDAGSVPGRAPPGARIPRRPLSANLRNLRAVRRGSGRQCPRPIHPAAHYAMGGIRTDLEGRTSLRAPLCRRRSGVHRRARRQPPGEQFAARGRGVRRARGRGHARVRGSADSSPCRGLPSIAFPASALRTCATWHGRIAASCAAERTWPAPRTFWKARLPIQPRCRTAPCSSCAACTSRSRSSRAAHWRAAKAAAPITAPISLKSATRISQTLRSQPGIMTSPSNKSAVRGAACHRDPCSRC